MTTAIAIGLIVAAAAGLVFWGIRRREAMAKQEGRDEVVKEAQREEIDAQRRAADVLAEHRTVDDTNRRLSDGSF